MRPWISVFGILLAGFGVVYLFWPDSRIIALYGIFALNIALLLTCISMSRAAKRAPPGSWERAAWLGLAIGFWMWLVAAVLEFTDLHLNLISYGSKSDAFWVIGYLPMFYGFYPRLKTTIAPRNRPAWFLLLLVVSYCAVFYAYLFPRLSDPIRNLPEKTLDIVYLSFNFLLLGMLLAIGRSLPAGRNSLQHSFREMSAATILMIVVDLLLGYFTNRESAVYQLLDLPYFVVYFLFFAATQPALLEKKPQ